MPLTQVTISVANSNLWVKEWMHGWINALLNIRWMNEPMNGRTQLVLPEWPENLIRIQCLCCWAATRRWRNWLSYKDEMSMSFWREAPAWNDYGFYERSFTPNLCMRSIYRTQVSHLRWSYLITHKTDLPCWCLFYKSFHKICCLVKFIWGFLNSLSCRSEWYLNKK
jgi:hypothetical protein